MVLPNYAYNRNLPNPPDDPADDVTGMQNNSQSIQDLITSDHINFNTAGSGGHKQSQYQTLIGVVAGGVPPTLFGVGGYATVFSNFNGSIQEELWFTRGASNLGIQLTCGPATGPVSAQNGFTFLPGKLLLQWGKIAVNLSGAITTIPFNTNFSANAYSVSITMITNDVSTSPNSNGIYIYGTNVTNANFVITNSSGSSVKNIYWMAIGPA